MNGTYLILNFMRGKKSSACPREAADHYYVADWETNYILMLRISNYSHFFLQIALNGCFQTNKIRL